jgi:ATP-dependent Clp protease adaptor protein ClpS
MSKRDYESEELTVTESRARLKKPPLFKVLLHNDDFTTMEFVVFVLKSVFQRADADAITVMLKVHTEGVGVAGVYTYEVAETKAAKAMELARAQEYPLLCSVEPEAGTDDGG